MDGNVMLSTELDTRPVTQSLSNLKRKIVEVFKGADTGTLQAGLKQVTAEIKATEAQARKAQTALDALMSGEKTPQSIKELERDLAATEKQAEKMSKGYDKMLAAVEKYKEYEGLSTTSFPEAQKFYEAQAALERYEKEWEAVELKAEQLRTTLDTLRQNPELTPEAQKYMQTIDETSRKLPVLRARYDELGEAAQRVGITTRLQQNSIVNGFQHIERRIIGLVKRVFFFTLITKALRSVRSQVSALIANDSQLASSLAIVKGNLATAFGTIWVTVLPALRALINFLAKATSYLVAFISWLTGKSFKTGQKAMQSISDSSGTAAGNTGKIGKAAKKAAKELNRMLLPFDQMNVLSKDTADNAGGTGGGADGGGAGGAGGAAGITWPKEMDGVMQKFEKFKDLILLIGAAFAAWKLAPILANLLKISRIRAFIGLTALIAGIALLVRGIRDLKKNGPTVENVCDIISGALLSVGGAILLLTGATGFGLILIAIGLVVLAFKNLYKNFKPFRKYIDGALKRIKKAFSKGKLKGFAQIGKEIILGILKGIVFVVKKIGSWIKKNVVDPIKKWFKKKFGIASPAKEMLDIGKDIALGILEGILEPFKKIGEWIQEHVLTPIKEALFGDGEDSDGLVVNIKTAFSDTKEAIKQKWDTLTGGLSDLSVSIKTKFEDTKTTLSAKWDEIKSGISETWAKIKAKFEDTKTDLKNKWNTLTEHIQDKLVEMKAKVATKWSDIKDNWHKIIDNIVTKTAEMKAKVATKWSDIKAKWYKITGNITNKTVEMKAKIGTKWSSLKTTWTNLLSHFGDRTFSMSVKLPKIEWAQKTKTVGPVSVTYPWPSVSWTKLAKGGVIPANKEFLAVLGDQKRGVNIETPLETMIDAFNTALQQNGYNGNQSVNVYLQGDAKQLFKVVRVEANNYTRSTGKAAFNL